MHLMPWVSLCFCPCSYRPCLLIKVLAHNDHVSSPLCPFRWFSGSRFSLNAFVFSVHSYFRRPECFTICLFKLNLNAVSNLQLLHINIVRLLSILLKTEIHLSVILGMIDLFHNVRYAEKWSFASRDYLM